MQIKAKYINLYKDVQSTHCSEVAHYTLVLTYFNLSVKYVISKQTTGFIEQVKQRSRHTAAHTELVFLCNRYRCGYREKER